MEPKGLFAIFTVACHWPLSWARGIPSCFLNIHFNIVLPSLPRSSNWLIPSGWLVKFYICMSSALVYHPTNTVFGKQYKLWSFQFWSLFILVSLLRLREKYSSWYPFVKHYQSDSSLNVWGSLYLYEKYIEVWFCMFFLLFWDRWKDKGPQVNGIRPSAHVFQS